MSSPNGLRPPTWRRRCCARSRSARPTAPRTTPAGWSSNASISRCARARSSRSSASRARANRPSCASSPGSSRRAKGGSSYRGKPVDGPVAGRRDGVPELRAVSLAYRSRQCRARAGGAGRARAAERRQPRGRRDRRDRPRRLRERLSEGAVGRHAAARRVCPRPRRQPRHPVARRAVLALDV